MEYLILIIFLSFMLIALKIVCKINIKKIEAIGKNDLLDEKINRFPSNIEICKKILKKVGNESVEIEEDIDASNCLYIVATNKIIIGYLRGSYTRIQTIAHECLHSIQDRRILMFNFIFSNIYLIYFATIIILTIFKITANSLLYLSIFLILSMVYYMVRVFLENDAMIKAKYLAKEYMEDTQISSKEEINKIVEGFENLNNAGIKCVNYNLFFKILIKVIIFSIVALIF